MHFYSLLPLFSDRTVKTTSCKLLESMNNPSPLLSRRSTAHTFSLILGLLCATVSGCVSLGYERELFPSDNVRVIHSEKHCKDVGQSVSTQFPNADRIEIFDIGIGLLVATRTAWEVIARQLAAELDADLSLVRPCDGEDSFQYAQIEVWRTRGFKPIVKEEYRPESGTLMAPSQTTYSDRLKNIFECFEQARVTSSPITPESKKRLGHVDATQFFSPGPYFDGYARVDKYFRPTRAGELSLAKIYSGRARAAWAAGIYRELSADERQPFAERYLICLLDRGYSWWSVDISNKALQPTPTSGAAELKR